MIEEVVVDKFLARTCDTTASHQVTLKLTSLAKSKIDEATRPQWGEWGYDVRRFDWSRGSSDEIVFEATCEQEYQEFQKK